MSDKKSIFIQLIAHFDFIFAEISKILIFGVDFWVVFVFFNLFLKNIQEFVSSMQYKFFSPENYLRNSKILENDSVEFRFEVSCSQRIWLLEKIKQLEISPNLYKHFTIRLVDFKSYEFLHFFIELYFAKELPFYACFFVDFDFGTLQRR